MKAALLLAIALAALLSGCGSSGNGVASKSPAEILAASKAAALDASSVYVTSRNTQGPLSSSVNVELASKGGRGKVSILGSVYELIRLGNTLYLKGSLAFYKSLGVTTHVPQNTWLKAPADSGPIAHLAVLTYLNRELEVLLSTTNPLAKGATTIVNGQKAIELKETGQIFSGSRFIATTGKPYPIEILKRGRETGQTTFSDWNQPVSLTAPVNAIPIG